MFVKTDWNGIRQIRTHPSSKIISSSYADHIIRIAARICRGRIVFRDEYMELCEAMAEKITNRNGMASVMKAVTVRAGYGRFIGGKFEIPRWMAEDQPQHHAEGKFCHIYAREMPWLWGKDACHQCLAWMESGPYGYGCLCETCNEWRDYRMKVMTKIWKYESEAKELRSLTRKLERCIREKVKATAPIHD